MSEFQKSKPIRLPEFPKKKVAINRGENTANFPSTFRSVSPTRASPEPPHRFLLLVFSLLLVLTCTISLLDSYPFWGSEKRKKMFTVLHKWDGYTAHSMDQVAKYLYQYYDTQTTEKLCLLFNMLEANTTNDPNHSRWEADDRWIVHADDVAEIEWPGEKRLKRKHHQIIANVDGTQTTHAPATEEDDKKTKAKRWDTFSKFLARIGFLKSSSKKSMAWVCSWTDTTGIFNRSKLKNSAKNNNNQQSSSSSPSIVSPSPSLPSPSSSLSPSISPSPSPHMHTIIPSSNPTIHLSPPIPSTPPSPQIPLSPHTPSSYSSSSFSSAQSRIPQEYNQFFSTSPSSSHLLQALVSANEGVTVSYQTDIMPFSFHPNNLNNLGNMNNLNNNSPNITPNPPIINLTNQSSLHFNNNFNSQNINNNQHIPINNNTINTHNNNNNNNNQQHSERIETPEFSNFLSEQNETVNSTFAPLANSAEKVPPSYPPTFALSSYLRDITESPHEYYENRGCAHAVSPLPILNILRYLRVRLHRDWENFSFTARARTEANKDIMETVKDCAWEHMLTRVAVIKISEGGSISSQIRKQFPPGRAFLSALINQHVIVRQRNLKFKNEKTTVKDVRKETSKGEFRLWSHIEPDTQLVFPPGLPSITKAYKYKDAFVHVATGLNLDSITKIKYNGTFLKFVKSKTVMVLLTTDEIDLDITLLMKGMQHVGHNEYPVIPQIVTVNITEAPKEGTILFGSYLKYVHNMKHDNEDTESDFPPPDQSGQFAPAPPIEDVKSENFTIIHPNVICAHTTFSPEKLTVTSWFVCGQRSFLGFEVSDVLL